MSDESKNNRSKSGKEISADELIEKGKELADKAENFFAEKASKVKNSNTYGKISGLFGKVESFMEDKSEEFQRGEMTAKFEAFRDKTEDQANVLIDKAKEAGRKIGDQIDESLDAIKGKKDRKDNQDGGGI